MKSQPLGKGLSHLISEQFLGEPTTAPESSLVPNPQQPRKVFDESAIAELADSILEHGILNPIVVKPVAGGKYEVIAGERRLRAARLAGLKEVPIRIFDVTEQKSLELSLIENLQREDISGMESARAYEVLASRFQLTQEEIAKKVGKSRVAVTNSIRLLHLPMQIQDAVQEKSISEGHARAILGFQTVPEQLAAFKSIVEGGLNVRQAEALTKNKEGAKPKKKGKVRSIPNDLDHIEQVLSEFLGSPVKIELNKSGSGKVTISFYTPSELERILEKLEPKN